jgi:nitroimidazol reductase NimA-like FMN-containing flavoprotein (pyridoxamine 5'-phosphate oxidase superfamily)
MNVPATKLDERFSDRGAGPTPWDETRALLETAELFWIATVRSNGQPHVTPLVAVWLDGALHFCTGATEQKAVNLKRNPRVTLTTGCNQWDRGVDVVVEGEAVQVTSHERLERLARAWAAKWDGRWRFEVRDGAFHSEDGGAALVFSVTPAKVFAFAKGAAFGQTRHRF